MYINVEREYDGMYYAIDIDTYDVDCDGDGFYSLSPIGYGKSALDASIDLLEQMEDEDVK